MFKWLLFSALLGVVLFSGKPSSPFAHLEFTFRSSANCRADDQQDTMSTPMPPRVDNDIGKHSDASKTDDEVVQK